ncbi:MAG: hypothetical protein Q8Q08_11090 [Candidatus Omnitrophota bacterium]|nr:hypothetical protein [Candidatus Omnitrophota bacterium]
MGAAKTLSVENRAIVKPSFTQGTMKANKAHQKDMSFALPLPEEKQDEKSAASTFDLPGPKRIPFRLEP